MGQRLKIVETQPTRQNSSECELCQGTGFQRGNGGVFRCACSRKRLQEAQLAAIPERFRGCTFENFRPVDDIDAAALAKIHANPGAGLYLWGEYGRGKTHLAVAQYKSLVDAGQSCAWRSMGELLSEVRAAEVHDRHSLVLSRARYADSFHLFLDDIDKFKPTEFKGEAMFDLFDTLYRRKLALTVTTNWSLRVLAEGERLHPAIARRLDDMCLAVRV